MTSASDIGQRPRGVPIATVLASIVGLWLCYFLITTLRGSIIGLGLETETLLRRGLVCLAGIGVTGVLWLLIRLVELRSLPVKAAITLIAAIPASLAIAQFNQWAFADIQGRAIEKIGAQQGVVLRQDEAGNILLELPEGAREDAAQSEQITLARAPTGLDRWRQLSGAALSPYFVILTWAALYLAILAGTQARAAERRAGEFREAARAAELRSLRYQVNPHFLFNSLNSLSALVMTGKAERAEAMIQTLSNFYRHSLAEDTTSDVDLADEFALQQHYLAIEAIRFPERLKTQFELPQALETVRIPGMILQPLVENSVKYAVAPLTRPVLIHIAAHEDAGDLVITVTDDGPGVHDLAGHGFGIGLANVRDRLKARYGGAARITAGPIENGYRTQIRIPMRQQGDAD